MRIAFLFVLFFAQAAHAADLVVPHRADGRYLLAVDFPADNDFVCFRPSAGEPSCFEQHVPVSSGRFEFAGRRYGGAPVGSTHVGVREVQLAPGTRVSVVTGNDAGEMVDPDEFLIAQAPAPAPTPTPTPTPIPPQRARPFMPIDLGPVEPAPAPAPDPTPAPGPTSGICGPRASDPSTVFCEDFENAAYVNGPLPSAWRSKYGPTSGSSQCAGGSCPFAFATRGSCFATGDQDCVFAGERSLFVPHRPGATGGRVGTGTFKRRVRDMGVAMAVRWSPTFVPPDGKASTCGGEGFRNGYKTDRFFGDSGQTNHELLGHGTSAPGACVGVGGNAYNFPFTADIDITPNGGPPSSPPGGAQATARVGGVCRNDVHLAFGPDPARYRWGTTHRPGQWTCVRFHVEDWGTSSARIRQWVDSQLVVDATANLGAVRGDEAGLIGVWLDAYVNGCYNGPDLAGRNEDNILVVEGPEAPTCQEIGFRP